ncbi:MAG: hypothetical protein QNJ68_15245 [Microcoleaceae cyanobacterium MO_207.B10]|nr:hypothetical protein [Microcoleaceae cyanobacterium MO_207.B10]
MVIFGQEPTAIKCENDFFQLIALICSLITHISVVNIPLILKQQEESIGKFREKIENLKFAEQKLEKCLDGVQMTLTICDSTCDSTRSSSEIFSPGADKAEMAGYYQRILWILYQIEEKLMQVLADNST